MGKARLAWFHMTAEGVIHRPHCASRPDLTGSITIDTKVIERLIRRSKLISIKSEYACLAVPVMICRICLEEFLQKALAKKATLAPRARVGGSR